MRIAVTAKMFIAWSLILSTICVIQGCEPPNPDVNTATSGKLTLYVDETYAPLIKELADSFMVKVPSAKIAIKVLPGRAAVQGMLDDYKDPSKILDTSTTSAIIIGRPLLKDESELMVKAQLDVKEYLIAYDGIAVAVPNNSVLDETMAEYLQNVLRYKDPTQSMLNKKAPPEPLHFAFTDQNSSVYSIIRSSILKDSQLLAPSRYYSTCDSVINSVANEQTISLISWYRVHKDSAKIRALRVGYTDSTKTYRPPTRIHVATLVTDAYPFKSPIYGYTFASTNSLATGFLAWISKGQDAQRFIAEQGLQSANVKFRLKVSDE